MQTTVSDAGTLRKQLTISIPASEVAARRNQLLDRYAGRVQLKGFRPGKKPPRAVVEKRLGPGLDDEVFQLLVDEAFSQGIKDNNLKPIGQISTEDSKRDGDITHVVAFDVQPEITLPEPQAIPVTISENSVSDEDVSNELDELAQRSGSYSDLQASDSLGKDDIVTLSGTVSHQGETIRDLHDLQHLVGAYPLLGLEPEQVIERIAALHVGETLSFDATLPDSFTPEEHVGKDAHIELTIQSARRMTPAELNDDLAQRFGLESLEVLKDRVRMSIEGRKQEEAHNKQSEEVMDYLIAECAFELPQTLRESIINERLEQERAKPQDEKDQAAAVDEAAITAEIDKDLRRHLITETIAETLNVTVTQQDLQQQISMAAYQSGRKPEEIAKQLQESGRINQVAAEIRSAKALSQFVESVVAAHQPSPAATSEEEASA